MRAPHVGGAPGPAPGCSKFRKAVLCRAPSCLEPGGGRRELARASCVPTSCRLTEWPRLCAGAAGSCAGYDDEQEHRAGAQGEWPLLSFHLRRQVAPANLPPPCQAPGAPKALRAARADLRPQTSDPGQPTRDSRPCVLLARPVCLTACRTARRTLPPAGCHVEVLPALTCLPAVGRWPLAAFSLLASAQLDLIFVFLFLGFQAFSPSVDATAGLRLPTLRGQPPSSRASCLSSLLSV